MFALLTGPWPLGWSLGVFAVAAAVTVLLSVRMVALGDTLADRTGWGEALLMTTVLLGGLLVRQVRGWWRLGFEGVLLIGIYLATFAVLAF